MSKIVSSSLKTVKIPTGIKNKIITKSTDLKIYPICDYTLNFDGCSKGNPGLAGIGVVIYNKGIEIHSAYKFIGIKTNNQSEYSALIFGLEEAIKMKIDQISIFGDSQIVINQVNGLFKIKSDNLLELNKEANELKKQFKYIEFNHIPREKNKRADELSNIALFNMYPTTTIEPNHTVNNTVNNTVDTKIHDLDEVFIEEDISDDMSEITVSNNIPMKGRPVKLINSFFPTIKTKSNIALPKIEPKSK